MVSSTLGSLTSTGWKRRSSAASCSIFPVLVHRWWPRPRAVLRERAGFEHVAGVHRTFGPTGSDHGVQFVDEHHQLVLVFADPLSNLFMRLEITAVAGTSDQTDRSS